MVLSGAQGGVVDLLRVAVWLPLGSDLLGRTRPEFVEPLRLSSSGAPRFAALPGERV